jgi:hypothetical protein
VSKWVQSREREGEKEEGGQIDKWAKVFGPGDFNEWLVFARGGEDDGYYAPLA